MRRAPIVLTSTVAGLALVLGFKAHEPARPVAAAVAAAPSSPVKSTGTTSATKTASTTKTVEGDAIDTRYGAAQVRVTITNGKITAIAALQLQGNDPKSVQISSSAEPLLQQSALTKQSAAVDAVSGATITSASYEASLQSALDKAGFEAADGSRGSSTVPDVQEEHDGPDAGGAFPGA